MVSAIPRGRSLDGAPRPRALSRALLALALWLLAAAALAQPLAQIPAMSSPVVDRTGTLGQADLARLQARALDLQRRKGSQLQVLMIPSTQPESIEQYAVRAFDQFQLGRQGVSDGLLLVVAKDDRRARIEVGYGLEGAITDAQSGRIIQEYLAPRFREGDYAGGLDEATAILVRLVEGESLPPPLAGPSLRGDRGGGEDGGWVLAVFLAAVGGSLVRAVFGRLPTPLRGALGGALVGLAAWFWSLAWWAIALAALGGALFAMFARAGGRYVSSGGWGGYGGGWGGGGGGWSGGGGSSGGGGASGSW